MNDKNFEINNGFFEICANYLQCEILDLTLLQFSPNDNDVDSTSHSYLLLDFVKHHDFKNIGNGLFVNNNLLYPYPSIIKIDAANIILVYEKSKVQNQLNNPNTNIVGTIEFITSLVSIFKHNYQIKAFAPNKSAAYYTSINAFEKSANNSYDNKWVEHTLEVLNTLLLKHNKHSVSPINIPKLVNPTSIEKKKIKKISIYLASTCLVVFMISYGIVYLYPHPNHPKPPKDKPAITEGAMLSIKFPSVDTSSDKITIEKGRNIALIIAINKYYQPSLWLDNCVNDGKTIEKILAEKYGFFTIHLYDSVASRENIMNYLSLLADSLKDNDNLVIYYSGHGHIHDNLPSNAGGWVPQDAKSISPASLISNSDIKNYLTAFNAKAQHVLLISDACFSGDLLRSLSFFQDKKYEKEYIEEYNEKSVTIMTSGGIEVVSDGDGTTNKGEGSHSVFAKPLIEVLSENKEHYCDASTIFNQTMKRFPINTEDQRPRFGHLKIGGRLDGEFVFRQKR